MNQSGVGWGEDEARPSNGLAVKLATLGLWEIGILKNRLAGGNETVKIFRDRAGIGAASGDRTHDILSHSQAFCR